MAEFTRVFRVQGMDSDATPRFQMVPSGGRRFVILRDGAGMTLSVGDPAVCNFTEILETALPAGDRAPRKRGDRFFRLEAGSSPVATTLTATGGGSPLPVSLEIGVKDKRQQLVMFNFVRDNAGHGTRRPAADVGRFMPTLKFIWGKQANVDIVNHGIRRVRIEQNLGATIILPAGSLGTTGETIRDAGAAGVNLNVFFVHDLQEAGNTADVDAVTTIGTASGGTAAPGTCIFEDNAGKDQALSLAHEIGHHLGLLDRDPRKDLMHRFTGQRGINLTRADVNTANP
jgi:hypothetical protein